MDYSIIADITAYLTTHQVSFEELLDFLTNPVFSGAKFGVIMDREGKLVFASGLDNDLSLADITNIRDFQEFISLLPRNLAGKLLINLQCRRDCSRFARIFYEIIKDRKDLDLYLYSNNYDLINELHLLDRTLKLGTLVLRQGLEVPDIKVLELPLNFLVFNRETIDYETMKSVLAIGREVYASAPSKQEFENVQDELRGLLQEIAIITEPTNVETTNRSRIAFTL